MEEWGIYECVQLSAHSGVVVDCCWWLGGAQVEELPADLFEFHEVVSHMQEVEEAVVDGHREFYNVSRSLNVMTYPFSPIYI